MITSKSNNIVKYVSSLKIKKYRDINNKYVVEGIKMVSEIINSEEETPEFILYSKEILDTTSIGKSFLKKYKEKFNGIEVSKEIFNAVADTESPQGVLAVIGRNIKDVEDLKRALKSSQGINLANKKDKYIILDGIQDQGNIGTIIRSSVAFGVKNIICLEGTTDVFSPKVVRSTMGGIRNLNIYYISNKQIMETLNLFKENKYNLVATTLNAKKYLNEHNFSQKDIFVFGNEANGISSEVEKNCNDNIKIEMTDFTESLNVSVAASVIMYKWYIDNKEY